MGLGLACIAALGCAQVARAADERETFLHRAGIRVRATYSWPTSCHRGWVPFSLRFENQAPRAQELRVTGRSTYAGRELEIEQLVQLTPHEVREVEWLVPVLHVQGSFQLILRTSVESQWIGSLGPNATTTTPKRAAMIFGPSASSQRVPTWLRSWANGGGPAGVVDLGRGLEWGRATYAELPRSWRALTSLDAVFLDALIEAPDEKQLELLARFARGGGVLVACGEEAVRALHAHSAFTGAFEPRFERKRVEGIAIHDLGLGVVLACERAFEELPGHQVELIGRAVAAQRSFGLDERGERRGASEGPSTALPSIEDLPEPPLRELLLALLAFTVLIGPANLWIVHRLGRPVLLLVTVPALSGAFCCGLIGLTLAREGLQARIASRSLTVLDQRAERRTTAELRAFYAPFSLGSGIEARSSSVLFPADSKPFPPRARYLVDAETGRLSGQFLPTRRETRQVVVEEAAAGERLSFTRRGVELAVTNQLGVALHELEVYDAEGRRAVLELPLAPGATAELTDGERASARPSLWDRAASFGSASEGPLASAEAPRDLYVAAVATPPWLDRGPIVGVETAGEHLVVGILELGELAPR